MNTLDIVFLALVAVLFLRGVFRGVMVEAGALVGALVGFFVANSFHATLAPFFMRGISNPGWAATVAHFIILVACVILATLAAAFAEKVLTLRFVGWTNKVGGGFLGLIKGIFLCLAVLAVFMHYFVADVGFLGGSMAADRLAPAAAFLEGFMPERAL